MSARARAAGILAVGVLIVVAVVVAAIAVTPPLADGRQGAQPPDTTLPAAPTTLVAPTAAPPDCTATTNGRDPEAFAVRCRGPITVTVTSANCLGAVGDGYHFTYTIANAGPTVAGWVTAQVDLNNPAVVVEYRVQLDQGASPSRGEAELREVTGDAVVVSLVTTADQANPVSSFPFELPHCPQAKEDLEQARRDRAPDQPTTTR